MGQCTEVFVGIDVSKIRNCVALAERDRGGEVRYLREAFQMEKFALNRKRALGRPFFNTSASRLFQKTSVSR